MKRNTKCWPGGQKLMLLVMVLLTSYVQCNLKCLVDQCKVCADQKVYTCQSCESGYYLRNLYASEKNKRYNDCWSYKKFWWTALASLLALLSYCLCCYLCHKNGVKRGKLSSQHLKAPKVKTPPSPVDRYKDRRSER